MRFHKPVSLKPLPYPDTFLEPFLSAKTLKQHHGHHQKAYVDNWNKISSLLETQRNRSEGDKGAMLRGLYESQAFNGSGIILHEMYWENLAPFEKSIAPSVEIIQCMIRCFGSVRQCLVDMVDVGTNIHGSGWVILAWVPRFDRMMILPVNQHQNNWIPGAIPLIVIDVWEHAYYLEVASDRNTYLKGIMSHLNWSTINRRFGNASSGNN